MIAITLQQILDADPCYDPITKHGLKGVDRNAPISFRKIVEVAGAQDAIWCFAVALPGHEALKRHFAVDCAERVIHLMTDPRSLAALEVARRHAKGQASNEELAVAQRTAWAAWTAEAAEAAARAAEAAARAAGAAWAAEAAAGDAWAAEAAWTAAEAAEAAAGDAEINWQGRRLIDLTEAGVWTPVEEADKRGWSSYGH